MFYLNKKERSTTIIDRPILHRTLPSLLDEACRHHSNNRAFNQWYAKAWKPLSNRELLTAAEELALGLQGEKLERGEHIAFLMHSDVNFCLADFGSLLAGLVNVPIDLTQTLDNIAFILRHSAAKVLIVSDLDLLAQVIPHFGDIPDLQTVIVAEVADDWEKQRTQLLTCGINNEFGIRSSEFGVKDSVFEVNESQTNKLKDNNNEFGVRPSGSTVCSSRETLPMQLSQNSELGVNRSKKQDQDSAPSSVNTQKETPNYELITPNSAPACLCLPMLLCQAHQELSCPELPQCIQLLSLDEVRARGRELLNEERRQELRVKISPQDLATIVYIAGETGQPKGVMLTHENITADILTTFKSFSDLKLGTAETILSFLPLTHIFARALNYGHLNYGHSIYFSTPNRAVRDFKTVRPTMVATVPRLLEKAYHKILDRGSKLKGIEKTIFDWALQLARSYELGRITSLENTLQLKLADSLVFAQWRKPFGGRLKYFISGGAALKAEIANMLSAAGMTVLQGYGLTETSSVICCNRGQFNRAGTVGLPIPGAKIAIADDGEIIVKAPYVMQGYYKNLEATNSVIDESGWLHTGDLGAFTPEGYLVITGSKKDLFKLSTGKYVIPQPLEERVKQSPLVEQAVVVGMQKKFCGMLIFPDLVRLQELGRDMHLNLPITDLLHHPKVIAFYQTLVDEANQQLPQWSKVKGFQLFDADLKTKNSLVDKNTKVNRAKVHEIFAAEINALYGEELGTGERPFARTEVWASLNGESLEVNFLFVAIDRIRSLYSTLRTFSIKRLTRKTAIKAKSSWKQIENYISSLPTMPWKKSKTS